jgi:hypothetical protein
MMTTPYFCDTCGTPVDIAYSVTDPAGIEDPAEMLYCGPCYRSTYPFGASEPLRVRLMSDEPDAE